MKICPCGNKHERRGRKCQSCDGKAAYQKLRADPMRYAAHKARSREYQRKRRLDSAVAEADRKYQRKRRLDPAVAEAHRVLCSKNYWADPKAANAKTRQYYWDNREVQLEKLKKRRKANPDAFKEMQIRSHLKRYGLTVADYAAMVESQGGLCLLCGEKPGGRWEKLHVDHDHKTGRVRGLLCDNCNWALGQAKDDPELLRRMAEYVSGRV